MEADLKQYRRAGQAALLDRVRKKLVPDTREERVRQQYVSKLIDQYGIPTNMMDTDCPLSRTMRGRREGSKERPDIIVWETDEKALLVIEAKEPGKSIDDGEALKQVMGYVKTLPARYVAVTNRTKTRSYRVEKSQPIEITESVLLAALESCSGDGNDIECEPLDFGDDTPSHLRPVIEALHRFLLQDEVQSYLPVERHGLSALEDLGQAYRKYGNASGGRWDGWYRIFLVRDLQGDHQTYGISIMAQAKTRDDPVYGNRKGTTKILVGVDDFELAPHNALQITLDTSLTSTRTGYLLTHGGRKSGVRKQEVLGQVGVLAPHLLTEDSSKIYLGEILSGRPLTWENSGDILLNILLYASVCETLKKQ